MKLSTKYYLGACVAFGVAFIGFSSLAVLIKQELLEGTE